MPLRICGLLSVGLHESLDLCSLLFALDGESLPGGQMFAQGCACHGQLLQHPGVVGGNVGKVDPHLRDLISPLLDIGEELVGAMERSGGLCLSHLQGPSEFLLRLVPLVARRRDAENDLVKLALAPFTTADSPGVLLFLVRIGAFVSHDDGEGRGDSHSTLGEGSLHSHS